MLNCYKLLTIFGIHSILDIWQSTKYTSVIYYLFQKIEDANKIDSRTTFNSV